MRQYDFVATLAKKWNFCSLSSNGDWLVTSFE